MGRTNSRRCLSHPTRSSTSNRPGECGMQRRPSPTRFSTVHSPTTRTAPTTTPISGPLRPAGFLTTSFRVRTSTLSPQQSERTLSISKKDGQMTIDIQKFILSHLIWIGIAIAAGIGFYSWKGEHDARLLAGQEQKLAEAQVKTLQQQIADRDKQTAAAVAPIIKIIHDVQTVP